MPNAKTVEEEISKAFYKQGLVDEDGLNDIKTFNMSRATRTDKGVHACQNCISAILLLDPDKTFEKQVEDLNKDLPSDIKVFDLFKVDSYFRARNQAIEREYYFYVPTYVFSDSKSTNLIPFSGTLQRDRPQALKGELEANS